MTMQQEILVIALFIALACSLSGCFLVLGGGAMITDSITHTVVLGIVLAYLIVGDLNSPFLLVGATLMGVVTVYLTDGISRTGLVKQDASIGLLFPLLFSIAIILISKYCGGVHLDTDMVLLGELAFAPFDRLELLGRDIGARGIYMAGGLLLLNLLFVLGSLKELTLITFDPLLASCLGISVSLLHYSLMTLVSLTAVGSFQWVGGVLVIGFMVVPPNTAYLLTNNVGRMVTLSCLIGGGAGVFGCLIAYRFDLSIPGTIGVVGGLLFLLPLLLSPCEGKRGLIWKGLSHGKGSRPLL